MSILFYDHLIDRSHLEIIVSNSPHPENQKGKILQLIDDILFQGIVKLILDKLDPSHHKTFLVIVHDRPYDPEIILYLKDKTHHQIEDEIKREGERLVQMILDDLAG